MSSARARVHRGGRKLVPVEARRYIVDHSPNARLVVLPQSGHFPFLEEPDRFNEEVDAFMRSFA